MELSKINVNGELFDIEDREARSQVATKAEQATTLAGYNIEDAYTKAEIDNKFMPLAGGVLTGDITVDKGSTYNIGTADKKIKNIYADEVHISKNTLYIGETPVLGTDSDTVVIKADEDQSVLVKTTGEGMTQLSSQAGVTVSALGANSNVAISAKGANGAVNISGEKDINLTAPNISLTGTTTIQNLNVTGTTTTVNSQDLEVKDNLITINKGEIGEGVSAGKAGIKVDRGDAPAYLIEFDESDDLFKVGMAGDLEVIATRPYVDNAIAALDTEVISEDANSIVDVKVTEANGMVTAINVINKATSIAEYGIVDAYTKTEVNDLIGSPADGKTLKQELTEVADAKQDNLSEAQLAAANSTITADKVSTYDGYAATIATKQNIIEDLAEIRANASKGAGFETKLNGIEEGAQVNLIETVKVDGEILAIEDKAVSIDLSGKQDVISDLETIRSGAALGATSIQKHQDISGKQDNIVDLETIRAGAALGATALQSHQDISGKQDVIDDLETIRSGAALGATSIQEHQDISGKANLSGAVFTGNITVPKIITSTGIEIY